MSVHTAQLPAYAHGESLRESPVREIRMLGLMRGEQVALHGKQLLSHKGETRIPMYAEA